MDKLLLDGVEVTTSQLSRRIGDAAGCDLLAAVTPTTTTRELVQLMEGIGYLRYSGLRLVGQVDLSIVRKFPSLRYVEIASEGPVDPRPLECLDNLRGLALPQPSAGLDFANFPKLEEFVGGWHAENANLRQETLCDLRITGFNPACRDLSVLRELNGLVNLSLTKTNIDSLAGLEGLEDLRTLDVAYAPKLAALDSLATSVPGLRRLCFDHAKAIESYAPMSGLRFLRKLQLSACAPMPDLGWIAALERLSFLSFVDTDVVSGDLSPLLSLERLRYVGTSKKRHYSHSAAELNAILQGRAEPI
ncbi:MAG TPA: leucine-rich repeat domain-containing protein [Polyangiaceae bacterium]